MNRNIMIDINNWDICLGNNLPMSVIVLGEELDASELKAVDVLLLDCELTRFNEEAFSFSLGWIEYTDESAWLYGRIAKLFEYANSAYQMPDLVMIEKISYFEYDVNDFHKLHTDVNEGIPFSSRKLTALINLSSSEDYRGGQVEYLASHKPFTVTRGKGAAMISPAYVLKEIKPVLSGRRRHLIAWISSPSIQL
jgi:PKHD-type hydroxylase